MNLLVSIPKREAISTVEFLPAVSIIMPFTPLISAKKNLEYNIRNVLAKVESKLINDYTITKALPVIIKLRNLFSNLNYNTTKKSIAIFVSPLVEQLYYFGAEMQEKIVIDPSFKISDLIYCKKEKKEFLFMLLSDKFSKLYAGNGTQLKLIKSNTPGNMVDDVNHAAEKTDTSTEKAGHVNCITKKFLFQMDRGLSIMLKSYPLPVVVIGPERLLEHYKTITQNEENLVQFIYGNDAETAPAELGVIMEQAVSGWKTLKQLHLLKQVKKAKMQNKLRTGIHEIMKASVQKKVKLLVIEKQYLNYTQTSITYNSFFKIDATPNEEYFIKNELDEIIKNVLESGGDVEFIDDGLLNNYRRIALIEE